MSEVKWIKIVTNFFDDTKIKMIEKMPEGDTIIVIWIKLMTLAGKCNTGGTIMLNSEIPFTEEMLFTYLDRPTTTCRLALQTFEQFKMIEVIEDIFMLSNWEKHQNIDGLDKIRKQNAERQKKFRNKNKQLSLGIDKEQDIDKELDIDKENERNSNVSVTLHNNCLDIFNYWNSLNIVKHRTLTNEMIKLIEKKLKEYTKDEIMEYMNRYNIVKNDNDYFFDYTWTLTIFLKQKNCISEFTDEGSKWLDYLNKKKNKTNGNNGTGSVFDI